MRIELYIQPEAIEQIEIKIGQANYRHGAGFQVKTVSNALMSVAYCVAVAIVDGKAFLDQFTEEKISDPRIQNLLKRCRTTLDAEVDSLGLEKRDCTTVTIMLKDGSRYGKTKDFAKGHPSNPMTREEIINKFKALTIPVGFSKQTDQIIDRIASLDISENAAQMGPWMTLGEHRDDD